MDIDNNKFRIGLWLVACLFLLIFFFDDLWMSSVDFAHHYTLVMFLVEHWHAPTESIGNLGEMYLYPPLSHIIAAIFAVVLKSPLMGMQLVVLLSILALWSSLGFAMQTLPWKAFCITALVFLSLLAMNHFFGYMELFGYEIVGNYFYAQLVGQAALVVVIAWSLFSERRNAHVSMRYFLIAIAILVIESIHLLPAIELFVFLILLMSVDFATSLQRHNFKTFIQLGLFVFLMFIAVVLHPTFRMMRQISDHGGGISFHNISGYGALLLWCCLVLISSGILWLHWWRMQTLDLKRSGLWLKYLALFGVAVSVLCLLQMLALFLFKAGSAYACFKYGFAINTIFLLELATLPVVLFKSLWARDNVKNKMVRLFVFVFFPCIFIGGVFFLVLPAKQELSVGWVVKIEDIMLSYPKLIQEKLPQDKSDYVIGLNSGHPIADRLIDYLLTVGILQDSRNDPNVDSLLFAHDLKAVDKVRSIFTSVGNEQWDITACRQHVFPNNLVQLDGACIQHEPPRLHKHPLNSAIEYSASGGGSFYFLKRGWSLPEKNGIWTDGDVAELQFHVDPLAKLTMDLQLSPFLLPNHNQVTVNVFVNGKAQDTWVLDVHSDPHHLLKLMPSANGDYSISFHITNPAAPLEYGVSSDSRKLGIFLMSSRITE